MSEISEKKDAKCHLAVTDLNKSEMLALIIVKSGTVNLQGCSLSVEIVEKNNLYLSKIPCLYQMPDSTTFITRCLFKGGGPDKADSIGVFNNKGNLIA